MFFLEISSATSRLHFEMFVSTALQEVKVYLSKVDLQPVNKIGIEIVRNPILKTPFKVIFYPANF